MKSLRLRLALISTAISGAVIAAFGIAGWMLTASLLQESIDLRLAVPLDRIVLDLHPRTDLQRVINNLEISFGDEVEAGKRRVLLLDRDGSELYRAPESAWVEQVDPDLLTPIQPVHPPELIRRTGESSAGPPLPGGGPEGRRPGWERQFEEDMREAGVEGGSPPPPRGDRPGPPSRPPLREGPPPGPGDPARSNFHTLTIEEAEWRAGIVEDRGYLVLMATDLSDYQSEVERVRRLFFLSYPACLLIIGFGGWFVAHRALRPVDLIAATASRVTASGLDQRIPSGGHDYEELRHLVEVLNGMMDRLEESFRYAMRFSADVSHELKTPLAVMQATVQDALKECEPGSSEEENLLAVNQEAERLKRITRSLMLLAQADAGQLAVRRESFSLSEEVDAICEDAEILCEKAGLTFSSEVTEGLTVVSDPVLLRQAMQNLVSNAVKYNRPEGEVRCRLYPFEESAEVVFEVANTGPGIEEEEQGKIFERFYRVDRSRSRDVDGFGLGLNLSWEIVQAMGGELRLVESTGEWTRFQVRLKTTREGDSAGSGGR